jgi:hypothetical protein
MPVRAAIDFPFLKNMSRMQACLGKAMPLFLPLCAMSAWIFSLLLHPVFFGRVSIGVLLFSHGAALFITLQRNLHSYRRGGFTRLKVIRNVLLDLARLLLVVAAASYLGGMAGTWLGRFFGMWAGLAAGASCAFIAAGLVRKAWGMTIEKLWG